VNSRKVDVLVIENQVSDIEMILEALHCHSAGIKTAVVTNGFSALDYLEKHKPGVILLNPMLSDMEGIEFLRTLRAQPPTADIPVIVLTRHSDDRSRSDVRELGVNGYVHKTNDVQVLADHFTAFQYLMSHEAVGKAA